MQANLVAVQDVAAVQAKNSVSKPDQDSTEQSFFDLIGGIMDGHAADAMASKVKQPDFNLGEIKVVEAKKDDVELKQDAPKKATCPAAPSIVKTADASADTTAAAPTETQQADAPEETVVAEEAVTTNSDSTNEQETQTAAEQVVMDQAVIAQAATQLIAQVEAVQPTTEEVAPEQTAEQTGEQAADTLASYDMGSSELPLNSNQSAQLADNLAPVEAAPQAAAVSAEGEVAADVAAANMKAGGVGAAVKTGRMSDERREYEFTPPAHEGSAAAEKVLAAASSQAGMTKSAIAGSMSEQAQAPAAASLMRAQVEAAVQRSAQTTDAGAKGSVPMFGLDVSQKSAVAPRSVGGVERVSRAQQAAIIQQIQKVLEQAAQNKSGDSMTLQLKPDELGAITLKVTVRDEKVHARLIPDSEKVESTLREHAADLMRVLTASGFKAENVTISFGAERSESEAFEPTWNKGGQLSQERMGEEGGEQSAAPVVYGDAQEIVRSDASALQGWVA